MLKLDHLLILNLLQSTFFEGFVFVLFRYIQVFPSLHPLQSPSYPFLPLNEQTKPKLGYFRE